MKNNRPSFIKRLLGALILSASLLTSCGPTNADKDLGTQSATDGGSNRMMRTDTANTLEDTAAVQTPEN